MFDTAGVILVFATAGVILILPVCAITRAEWCLLFVHLFVKLPVKLFVNLFVRPLGSANITLLT